MYLEKDNSRAVRRHLTSRTLIRRRAHETTKTIIRNLYGKSLNIADGATIKVQREVVRALKNPVACSCSMCGNPRKANKKKSLKELSALQPRLMDDLMQV